MAKKKVKKQQFKEGILAGCQEANCVACCCDDDRVEEWIFEYFAFHEPMKDHLISKGIEISFDKDRVSFKKCSDGKNCKFLKYSLNKDIDPRPIDCKIYPYEVDWDTIDFDAKKIKLYYWSDGNGYNDCPLVVSKAVPEEFKKEVEGIIKRDFGTLFHGAKFSVEFVDKVKGK